MSQEAKAGYKGKIYINDAQIGGIMTWSYSGETRELIDDSPLGQEHNTHIVGPYEGGEITFSGKLLLHSSNELYGQKELKDWWINGTELTNVKLYYDYSGSDYLEPDSDLSPASFVTITKYNEVSCDRGGLVTIAVTAKVAGRLKDSNES